jgi:hypothetical protein
LIFNKNKEKRKGKWEASEEEGRKRGREGGREKDSVYKYKCILTNSNLSYILKMQLILQDQLKPETLVCYPKSNITHIY